MLKLEFIHFLSVQRGVIGCECGYSFTVWVGNSLFSTKASMAIPEQSKSPWELDINSVRSLTESLGGEYPTSLLVDAGCWVCSKGIYTSRKKISLRGAKQGELGGWEAATELHSSWGWTVTPWKFPKKIWILGLLGKLDQLVVLPNSVEMAKAVKKLRSYKSFLKDPFINDKEIDVSTAQCCWGSCIFN